MAVFDPIKSRIYDWCPHCAAQSGRYITTIDMTAKVWVCTDANRTVRISHPFPTSMFGHDPGFEEVTPVTVVDKWSLKTPAEDQYPSKCPRCKRRAYIGLNEVEHADPALDSTCR